MTSFKANMTKAESELAKLEAMLAEAKFVTGEASVIIANDPESEELLAPYRRNLDQTKTFEICEPQFPGSAWYAEYAKAAQSGDNEYARELLLRGRPAMRPAAGPRTE
jgi:hypothetical protein